MLIFIFVVVVVFRFYIFIYFVECSAAAKEKTIGLRRVRVASFPPFLTLVIAKFTVSASWTPIKLGIFAMNKLVLRRARGENFKLYICIY